eukprot:TRINITY_DN46272_c0_g1_i1.p2 TRINITY_DN46272_c0_g1~~TRINITY_DN46272_c0_g1_i1.p2  ORF type:complete len:158 (+),score=42.39 TRINITY_DN46272_c0_g1_i1:29-502(+)
MGKNKLAASKSAATLKDEGKPKSQGVKRRIGKAKKTGAAPISDAKQQAAAASAGSAKSQGASVGPRARRAAAKAAATARLAKGNKAQLAQAALPKMLKPKPDGAQMTREILAAREHEDKIASKAGRRRQKKLPQHSRDVLAAFRAAPAAFELPLPRP